MRVHVKHLVGWGLVFMLSVGGLHASSVELIEAVQKQDKEAVRLLLNQHVDVNAAEPDGTTALHWAANRDDLDTANLLIRAGARVGAANDFGVTPLFLACTNGSAGMIKILLNAGADSNVALPAGETALMTAARTGGVDAVRALLARGANVNAKEALLGQTALMWAASEMHADVARALIESGADPNARSDGGFTTLMFSARQGDLETARLLLAAGANVNDIALDGSSVLLVATVRGHVDFAEFLLAQGANVNADGAGYTALHWAAGKWESALTRNIPVESEWSAVGGVPAARKPEFIKAILAHGANPNARIVKTPPRFGVNLFWLELEGATPFLVAAMSGDAEVMDVLAAHGANPQLTTNENVTPVMAAAGHGRDTGDTRITEVSSLEAVKLAVELGGDITAVDAAGDTALHATAYSGLNAVARFLVEQGANVNARNKQGQTPLNIAEGGLVAGMIFTQESTAELLRELGGVE